MNQENNTCYGPYKAIAKHWLAKESQPVLDTAKVLRSLRNRFGMPVKIVRDISQTIYIFHSGFDRIAITCFK